MKIILGSDHRGFALKEQIKKHLSDLTLDTLHSTLETIDVGAIAYDADDDYIDYATKAVKELQDGDRVILLCGSGHGMDITANRFSNIRAILGFNAEVVKQGREHEDANCLIIPSDWTSLEQAIKYIEIFSNTSFSNDDRHIRRLKKIQKLDTSHS